MTESEYKLNIGGKYLVKIAEEDDMIGIFKGYSTLGSDPLIVIEMDGGVVRMIPVTQIMFIDVLDSGKPEEHKPVKNRETYYG